MSTPNFDNHDDIILADRMHQEPQIGMKVHHERLGLCTIVAIHKFGTFDVVTVNDKYFRISGLQF